MCELFALSSRLPATVSLSLKTLAEHGGGSAPSGAGVLSSNVKSAAYSAQRVAAQFPAIEAKACEMQPKTTA